MAEKVSQRPSGKFARAVCLLTAIRVVQRKLQRAYFAQEGGIRRGFDRGWKSGK